MSVTYREVVDCASEMDGVHDLLQLSRVVFFVFSVLYRSFERIHMGVTRLLPRVRRELRAELT